MSLTLYNTMTRSKQLFQPIDPARVTLYVCGPTVYNRVHIGNARPAVIFDTLYRLLNTLYPKVVYARNITDIDDKIMATAAELGEEISSVSQRYAEAYFDDMAALNNLAPTVVPYATDHIPEMIDMVSRLVAKGHAYAVDNGVEGEQGHVLFAVQSMRDYGSLSRRSLDDMLAGARVEVAAYKKYAGDFVLWKPSADHEPGWDSPWGRGRPGWHLECSAMIEKHLGDSIDIHGGGQDLQFPHHENEIAQSCCAHDGKPFANVWMHNGFINIEGEKMSKSLGNFRMVNDLLQQYPGEVLRYVILSAHYRSEQNFSKDLLDSAWRSLDTLYGFLRSQTAVVAAPCDVSDSEAYRALLDDLNTPVAVSELHKLARQMHGASGAEQALAKGRLLAVAHLMGLLQQDPEAWFKGARGGDTISAEEIEELIAKRNQAKADRDFQTADAVRNQLKELGVTLEDSREGTQWRRD